MSLEELYRWVEQVREIFPQLGHWQVLGLALFSYGVVLARACAPSQVAEKLPLVGRVSTVQRRLERFLANQRVCWQHACQRWSSFILRRYVGEQVILLVDETKLGKHLSAMVVGLAYQGCCLPLAFWCYQPTDWPKGQVALIAELLSWIAGGLPAGCVPLLQADRGIGTSPDLVQVVNALGWHYLFRVQGQTRFLSQQGDLVALKDLVTVGGYWTARGKVFRKAGWLSSIVHVLWEQPYRQAWCLITNCPTIDAYAYARRYWQEASFRDLKSDGWQWQASHIFSPAHANLLLLVLTLAYAWTLSLGTLALEEPTLQPQILDKALSLFRHGLRLWDAFLGHVHALFMRFSQDYFVFFDPLSLKTVGL